MDKIRIQSLLVRCSMGTAADRGVPNVQVQISLEPTFIVWSWQCEKSFRLVNTDDCESNVQYFAWIMILCMLVIMKEMIVILVDSLTVIYCND
jgi:hypothetical protein